MGPPRAPRHGHGDSCSDDHHDDARGRSTQDCSSGGRPDASGWPGRAAAWHEPTAGGAPRDRYIDEGPSGLISRRRGRPSNNQLAPGVAGRAIAIIRERYADFGPTLAAEKLQECHGVVLSKETVRALMVSAGLWMPRRQRAPKIHQPRNRRHCLGELIQIASRLAFTRFEQRSCAALGTGASQMSQAAPCHASISAPRANGPSTRFSTRERNGLQARLY
jgi:hypothetical protein